MRPWADYELQCLYDLVNEVNWLGYAERLIRGRSTNAIRAKMSALRRDAGIIPTHVGPKARARPTLEYDSAKYGSEKLLNALLRMAA